MKRSSKAPVTILDMARHLNLSASAVSQALRHKVTSTTKVSESTAKAVRELAQKWNYRPNSSARRMKGESLRQAGFIVEYRLANRRIPWVNLPALLGVSDYLIEHKWHLNIIQDDRTHTSNQVLPHYLEENTLDGIILTSESANRDKELVKLLSKYNIPTVILNGFEDKNTVILDDTFGATVATQHLLDLGHTNIVFITSQGNTHYSAGLRQQAYIKTMEKAGLSPQVWSSSIPLLKGIEPEATRHQINELRKKEFYYDLYMPKKPTAIVCVSDIDALRTSQILLEKGIRIPEDVSIVGYDDLPYLDLHYPPLTTVRSDFYEMGVRSAEMLLHLISEKLTSVGSITIKPSLVVRKSTGPCPR
jgi:LacI family transcriptional regulator